MYCGSCGATLDPEQAFCASCGQPTSSAASAAAPTSPQAGPVTFELTASALGLFGWSLLFGICLILVVPAPFAFVSFWRWLYGHLVPSDGRFLEFKGQPGDVWVFTTAYGVLLWSSGFVEGIWEDNEIIVGIATLIRLIGTFVMMWWGLRLTAFWTNRDNRRLGFGGSLLGIVGWNLLTYVGFVTIIGWAWVYEFFSRWIAGYVQGLNGTLNFIGKGHQILWRAFATLLFCIPIVTIPWATLWFYAWYVEQFRIEENSQAVNAS